MPPKVHPPASSSTVQRAESPHALRFMDQADDEGNTPLHKVFLPSFNKEGFIRLVNVAMVQKSLDELVLRRNKKNQSVLQLMNEVATSSPKIAGGIFHWFLKQVQDATLESFLLSVNFEGNTPLMHAALYDSQNDLGAYLAWAARMPNFQRMFSHSCVTANLNGQNLLIAHLEHQRFLHFLKLIHTLSDIELNQALSHVTQANQDILSLLTPKGYMENPEILRVVVARGFPKTLGKSIHLIDQNGDSLFTRVSLHLLGPLVEKVSEHELDRLLTTEASQQDSPLALPDSRRLQRLYPPKYQQFLQTKSKLIEKTSLKTLMNLAKSYAEKQNDSLVLALHILLRDFKGGFSRKVQSKIISMLLIYALVADTHLNSINTYIVEFRSKRSRQEFFEVFKELLVPRLHFQKMVATLVKMSGPENPPFLVSLAQALANGYITGVGDLPLLQLFKSLLKKILKLNGHLNAEGHFQVAQMLEHYATLARALPKKMAFFKSADEVSRYAIKAMQRATLAHELAGVELESLILQMQNLKEPLSENEKARLEHKVEVVKNRLEQLERLIWRIEGLQGHEMVIAPRSNEGAAREFLLALQTYIRQSQWSDSVVLKFFKALNTNVGLPKIAQEHLALIKRASDGKNSFEHSLAAIEKLSQAALDDPLREHTAFEHIYLTKILNPQQRLYHVTRPISPKL